jgi:hypothetical protein
MNIGLVLQPARFDHPVHTLNIHDNIHTIHILTVYRSLILALPDLNLNLREGNSGGICILAKF